MRNTVFTCDHCGKELDEMHDYTEMEIIDLAYYIETDLCKKCYEELSNIILEYCNKKEML